LGAYRSAYPGASPGELLAAIETDWWCRIPALRLAEAHAQREAATYMYEFAWHAPEIGALFGACHALEIPFVFDTLDLGPAQMLGGMLGGDPPQELADAMHGAWVKFAATGDPGWPRYEPERRATMRFDTVSRLVDDPRSFERRVWEGAL
jgi:para-nitrobenzyl esterase